MDRTTVVAILNQRNIGLSNLRSPRSLKSQRTNMLKLSMNYYKAQ